MTSIDLKKDEKKYHKLLIIFQYSRRVCFNFSLYSSKDSNFSWWTYYRLLKIKNYFAIKTLRKILPHVSEVHNRKGFNVAIQSSANIIFYARNKIFILEIRNKDVWD